MCYSNFLNDDCTLNIENCNYPKLLGKQDTCESRIPFSADPNNRAYSVNAKDLFSGKQRVIYLFIFFCRSCEGMTFF